MLILFGATSGSSGPEPPELPNLHIQDAETLLNVPVAGNDGWDSDFLQAQTLCCIPMTFGTPELALAAHAGTETYWSRRQSKVLVRINFSSSGANAVIRPLFTDTADVVSVGESVTVTALARQDGVAYMSPLQVFELYGANKIGFVIDSISAGTIDVSIAGV